MASIVVLGLAGSIVLHELSHSLVAARFGAPVSSITLFMFGGVAALDKEPKTPKAELLIALAGPAMSFVLAAGFHLISIMPGSHALIASTAQYLGLINLILAVFNLLPAFPMDGGRALRAGVWAITEDKNRATHIAAQAGKIFGSVFMGLGFLAVLLGNFIGGLWWVLIGGFIRAAAAGEYESLRIKTALAGQPVRNFMTQAVDAVPSHLSIREFVNDHLYVFGHDLFPVLDDGYPVGTIGLSELKSVPEAQWDRLTLATVMSPLLENSSTSPHTAVIEALSQMSRSQKTRLLVIEQRRLVGVLVLKDLLDQISIRLALGEGKSGKAQTV
jgi:Zn-dependent protease